MKEEIPACVFIPKSKVGDFTKSCNGKKRYTTNQARRKVQEIHEQGDHNIWYYHCHKCRKVHIGHSRYNKQKNRNGNEMHNFMRAEIRITRRTE